MSYVDPVQGRNALEMTAHVHDDMDHAAWVDHFADHHGVFVGEIVADWTPHPLPLPTLLAELGLDMVGAVEREDAYHVDAYEMNLLRAWHALAHTPTALQAPTEAELHDATPEQLRLLVAYGKPAAAAAARREQEDRSSREGIDALTDLPDPDDEDTGPGGNDR